MFVVIDGSSLMCVSYYGNLPDEVKYAKTEEEKQAAYEYIERNSKGVYINGIKAFVNTLLNIVEALDPSHIAICFDKSRATTFRREMYADYKGQRTPSPEPLSKQMQNIQTLLKAVRIPILLSEEYEADDYVGSICKKFEQQIPVRFMTKDKDYLQLISPWTKGWMMLHSEAKYNQLVEKYGYQDNVPFGCYEFDEEKVFAEYGVDPDQVADWKGISGDPSDNLPGIKGVSDKSAIPLLRYYDNLENIVAAVEEAEANGSTEQLKQFWKTQLGITRPPIANILAGKEQGKLCKELATIKTDLDVGNLYDYEVDINYSLFRDLAEKLELNDLIPRLESHLNDFEYYCEER